MPPKKAIICCFFGLIQLHKPCPPLLVKCEVDYSRLQNANKHAFYLCGEVIHKTRALAHTMLQTAQIQKCLSLFATSLMGEGLDGRRIHPEIGN